MRKILSLMLALTMVLGMATTAFAAENEKTLTDDENSVEIPVTGEYIAQKKSDEIISVDVEWTSMDFTYAASFQGTWNPLDHSYTKDTEHDETGDWVNDTAEIGVTNHSNVDVTVNYTFKAADGYDTVTGRFYNAGDSLKESITWHGLQAGVENQPERADSSVTVFEIGGSLDSDTAKGTQIGTITVSVEKTKTADSGDTDDDETVTYSLSTTANSVYYWNQNGTSEKGDPDWTKLTFTVTGTDGSTKTLQYSEVTVTPLFEGGMDLTMVSIEEGQIYRQYKYQATASSSVTGLEEDLTCEFTVTVCNNTFILPSNYNDTHLYL